MRITIAVLVLLFLALQYALWMRPGGILPARHLQTRLEEQAQVNEQLLERNRVLAAEVADLKSGHASLEERARTELGMVRPEETVYQLSDTKAH